MIGKIIGAGIGRRLAGPDQGLKGALLGAAAPWLIRRAFTPLGFAALGAYGAIKLYDRHRARQNAGAGRTGSGRRPSRKSRSVQTQPARQLSDPDRAAAAYFGNAAAAPRPPATCGWPGGGVPRRERARARRAAVAFRRVGDVGLRDRGRSATAAPAAAAAPGGCRARRP